MAVRVSTKVVASARPMAVSTFLDTPMNGHRPRNCTRTKLLTRMALTMIRASSVIAWDRSGWAVGRGPVLSGRGAGHTRRDMRPQGLTVQSARPVKAAAGAQRPGRGDALGELPPQRRQLFGRLARVDQAQRGLAGGER